jgi:SWI/SNF-related matrix-associated actin-dependent regulator 1 of chromatin subfamily A
MKPFPYQLAGIEFLAGRKRAALLDEPGLGKTGQALEAMNRLQAKRTLLIVPLVVVPNWERELGMWAPWASYQRLKTGSSKVDPDVSVVLCPTSLLSRRNAVVEQLAGQDWDVVIVDEAHHFKNHESRRTINLYGGTGIAVRAEHLWLLTGTLVPNNPSEVWTHLLHLAPERMTHNGRLISNYAFVQRYCEFEETRFGRKIVGAKNTEELRGIIDSCSLRRLQADVLGDLPAMRRATVSLPTPNRKQMAPLSDLLDRMSEELRTDVRKLGGAELLQVFQQSDSFSTYRRLCGELKTELAAEWLREELDSGMAKVVVFAQHRGVIEELAGALADYGVEQIHGGVDPDARQDAVDRFQKSTSSRVIICQLTAASVGITLTASTNAVFVETDWVPGTNIQAEKRIHRIGQQHPVLVRYLQLADSIDQIITEALVNKTAMINSLETA